MVLFLVVAVSFGCTNKKEQTQTKDNKLNFTGNSKGSNLEEQKPQTEPAIESSSSNYVSINGASVYQPTEEIKVDNIVFRDFQVLYSGKELPAGVPKEEFIYFDEKAADNGALIDNNSYIFINITVENKSETPEELYLSFGTFAKVNSKNDIIEKTNEVRYRSDYKSEDATRKDYYRCELGANESHTYKVGYVITDSMLQSGSLFFQINKDGDGVNTKDYKYYEVKI